eukprot:g3117.t1
MPRVPLWLQKLEHQMNDKKYNREKVLNHDKDLQTQTLIKYSERESVLDLKNKESTIPGRSPKKSPNPLVAKRGQEESYSPNNLKKKVRKKTKSEREQAHRVWEEWRMRKDEEAREERRRRQAEELRQAEERRWKESSGRKAYETWLTRKQALQEEENRRNQMLMKKMEKETTLLRQRFMKQQPEVEELSSSKGRYQEQCSRTEPTIPETPVASKSNASSSNKNSAIKQPFANRNIRIVRKLMVSPLALGLRTNKVLPNIKPLARSSRKGHRNNNSTKKQRPASAHVTRMASRRHRSQQQKKKRPQSSKVYLRGKRGSQNDDNSTPPLNPEPWEISSDEQKYIDGIILSNKIVLTPMSKTGDVVGSTKQGEEEEGKDMISSIPPEEKKEEIGPPPASNARINPGKKVPYEIIRDLSHELSDMSLTHSFSQRSLQGTEKEDLNDDDDRHTKGHNMNNSEEAALDKEVNPSPMMKKKKTRKRATIKEHKRRLSTQRNNPLYKMFALLDEDLDGYIKRSDLINAFDKADRDVRRSIWNDERLKCLIKAKSWLPAWYIFQSEIAETVEDSSEKVKKDQEFANQLGNELVSMFTVNDFWKHQFGMDLMDSAPKRLKRGASKKQMGAKRLTAYQNASKGDGLRFQYKKKPKRRKQT